MVLWSGVSAELWAGPGPDVGRATSGMSGVGCVGSGIAAAGPWQSVLRSSPGSARAGGEILPVASQTCEAERQ